MSFTHLQTLVPVTSWLPFRQSAVANALTGETQTRLLDNMGARGCWLILLGTDGQAGVGGLIKAGCTRMQ